MENNNRKNPLGTPINIVAPYVDGAYLATNAISDAYLIYHAHDCGYFKAEKIVGHHDLFSDLLRYERIGRVVRSNIGSKEFVLGGEDRLSRRIRQITETYRCEVLFVVSSNVSILAGEDLRPHLVEMEGKTGVPIVTLPERHVYKDYLTGYLDTVKALLERVQFNSDEASHGVAITGFVFERNEADTAADIEEIKSMLAAMGVEVSAVFLDGGRAQRWKELPPPEAVIDIAHGEGGGATLANRYDIPCLEIGAPIGIEGTKKWLEEVAAWLNAEAKAKSYIEWQLEGLVDQLEWIIPRYFLGRGAILFADRLKMVALADFLEEIGLTVLGAECTSHEFEDDAKNLLAQRYGRLPVMAMELREYITDNMKRDRLHIGLGTSLFNQNAAAQGLPFVEIGYPSNFHHALYPRPTFGFGGVRVLIERMINAINATEIYYGSNR